MSFTDRRCRSEDTVGENMSENTAGEMENHIRRGWIHLRPRAETPAVNER